MEGFGVERVVEDLHPDLIPYLRFEKTIPYLSHPLVISPFYFEEENSHLNRSYLFKIEQIKLSLKNKEWHRYIFWHERPYRLMAFRQVVKYLSDVEYWKLLREIWVDSENIWQNKKDWKRYLNSKRENKSSFMKGCELNYLKELPDEFLIYRGYTKGLNSRGCSYTLDKEKAIWFSKRFNAENGKIKIRKVRKEDVFAYVNSRDEKEIIIL